MDMATFLDNMFLRLFNDLRRIINDFTVDNRRGVEKQNVSRLDHDELLQMFYSVVLPLPQRKYKLNRKGMLATKNQIMFAKRKRTHEEMTTGVLQSPAKDVSAEGYVTSRIIPSLPVTPARDRLRPPPDVINYDRKVIKLGGKSKEAKNDSNNTPVLVKNNIEERSKDLNHIHINTIDTSDSSSLPGNRPSTVKITKIMPPEKKPTHKIKLSRTSKDSIPTPELMPLSSPDSQTEDGCDSAVPTQYTSIKTPPTPSAAKQNLNGKEQLDESEETVTKKFRRIDIKFP